MKMKYVGFLVNPIAGMGGRVGLKGTDGVVDKAKELGAKPTSPKKALQMFEELISFGDLPINWYTCKGEMGSSVLERAGIKNFEIVYEPKNEQKITTAEDTKNACKAFIKKNVDLILFCGGDGTTRDIYDVIDKKIPILGIPSGVKMHSGVFGVNVKASAKMLKEFVDGNLVIGDAEIMDLDEDLYRKGKWKIKLFGTALGIVEPTYVQVGKMFFESISDEEIKDEIADYMIEEMDKEILYLLGSGSTVGWIGKKLDLDTTILGIDAIFNKKLIGKDLNEMEILKLLDLYRKVKIILSPIGAQGFILGRGNLQLSPEIIKKVGIDKIIVISTPSKLSSTPVIRVDTGDDDLDRKFAKKGYLMVVVGYRFMRVVKIQTD